MLTLLSKNARGTYEVRNTAQQLTLPVQKYLDRHGITNYTIKKTKPLAPSPRLAMFGFIPGISGLTSQATVGIFCLIAIVIVLLIALYIGKRNLYIYTQTNELTDTVTVIYNYTRYPESTAEYEIRNGLGKVITTVDQANWREKMKLFLDDEDIREIHNDFREAYL